ncbi:MAG: hypothetical protein IJ168_08525 [Eubacterium sp.]|nr:hypothetical protein [Eubacterium sp.]
MKKETVKSDNYNAAFFARVACFILVFALIIGVLSRGPFSNKQGTTYNNYYRKAYSYLLEPEDTIDVVCMGTSEAYTGFIPNAVFEKYGYTCLNTSMTYQTSMRTYTFLTDLLKHQDIKVLVLETDMLYYGYHSNDSYTTPFYEKYTAAAEPFFSRVSESRFDDIVSTHASVFNFNDRWKRLEPQELVTSFHSLEPYDYNHGYYFVTKTDKAVKPNKNMEPTDEVAVMPYESHWYLDKLIDLCQDKGIAVVLFEFPQARDYSYAKHNAIQQAADRDGVTFVDMNLMLEELGIDYTTDFRDAAHVNYSGAVKVTDYVADYLHAHYGDLLTDRRGDVTCAQYEAAQRDFIYSNFFEPHIHKMPAEKKSDEENDELNMG